MTTHEVETVKEVLTGAMSLTDTPRNQKLIRDVLDILVTHIDEPDPDLSFIEADFVISP